MDVGAAAECHRADLGAKVVIERDCRRFREIVRGKVRENLRKYMSNDELIGRRGGRPVSIPVPNIQIPRFHYGHKQTGGVGQGEGDKGEPIMFDPTNPGAGDQAGDQPGDHILEVEISLEELARILGEELELPNVEPKGKKTIENIVDRYTAIRRVGPESLRHFRRTYKEALKRQIASGTYDFDEPCVVPVREDRRYRSWKSELQPESNAVIFYMMDVSGSMSDRKKELVRLTAFWIDTWLRYQYRKLDIVYIAHDARADEVDQHTFYHLRSAGGTMISSAYKLALEIMLERFCPMEWNVYMFHFTDGENWGDNDEECIALLSEEILPFINLFCYGEVRWSKTLTRFSKRLQDASDASEGKIVVAKLQSKDDVYDAIKAFLGKGR